MAKYRFTDKRLQSIAPPKNGRLEFTDAVCPNLQIRVSYTGTKTFSAVIRVNGRQQRRTIGRYPAWSLAKAREQALKLVRDGDAGVDPRAVAAALAEAPLLKELISAYVDRHLKPNIRSWRNIEANLRHARLRPLQTRIASSITKREVISVIDQVVADGAPHGAANLLKNLKMAFNWAVGRDMVPHNPCDRIKPPIRTTERDRVLSDAEIVMVWRGMGQLPPPYGAMFRSFLLTGQRRSEVATMRWRDIEGDIWTIPREVVKKDRAHAVPLSEPMAEILKTLPYFGEDAFVFTTDGGESPSSNFAKTKRALDRLSGVKGWTIHDLRRTVRSKLAELGVSREVARKIVNHEDSKVDRIYNRHEFLSEKREALQRWAEHLDLVVAGHI